MSAIEFYQFPCLDDNYGVLVHDSGSGRTAAIDAPDGQAVMDALDKKGWNLSDIFVTHHHYDHTQGIKALCEKYNCKVIGPQSEADKIGSLNETLDDGDSFSFGDDTVEVISTPGHTLGMINYYFKGAKTVFTGDTLFALGCGRIFEGDTKMMWKSMSKLAELPRETQVYCGHEYTLSNAHFALTIDGDNEMLQARVKEIEKLREKGEPTLPTQIGLELDTNPFLRVSDKNIRAGLDMENASDAEVFAQIRTRKDNA